MKIVCPEGAQVLSMDLPGYGARQEPSKELSPWTVVLELQAVMDWARVRWDAISLRANSIGAYFAMLALGSPDKALLVSPVLGMERLILDMMGWANVTQRERSEKGEIAASFGQTLSWANLRYVRGYPVHVWQCPIRKQCTSVFDKIGGCVFLISYPQNSGKPGAYRHIKKRRGRMTGSSYVPPSSTYASTVLFPRPIRYFDPLLGQGSV